MKEGYTSVPTSTTTPNREELTPERRAEIRACLIHHDANNALRFQAKAIRRYGAAGGIMCRELLFWDGKGHDPDGFIYLTKQECEERTGLSAKSQDGGRKRLEDAGVLEVERRPKRNPDGSIKHPSPVLHYRLDLGVLFEQLTGETLDHWFKHADADVRTRGSGSSNTPNGRFEHANEASPYTEGTSESTSEVSLAGRTKPKRKRETRGNAVGASTPDKRHEASDRNPGKKTATQEIADELPKPQVDPVPTAHRFDPDKDPEYKAVLELIRDEPAIERLFVRYREGKQDLVWLCKGVCHELTGTMAGAGVYRDRVLQAAEEGFAQPTRAEGTTI